MRAALTALIAAVTLTGVAAPAAAQTASDRADVRCILVLTVAARDPKDAPAARQGLFYFIGRVDGHGLTSKLESLMLSESTTLKTAPLIQAELTRCGQQLTQRSAALRAMSQRLQAAGQPATPPAK